jgi:TonB family protein
MTWWQYLLLANIYLLLFYGFYVLLLSRERFFQLNRLYLISAVLLAFLIPGMQSEWVKSFFITQKVQATIYSSALMYYRFEPVENYHLTIGQVLLAIYITGLGLLMLRFGWQLMRLRRVMRKQYEAAAYSFFGKINLGDGSENAAVIAAHEHAHAREWHSADVLLMEALVIINWFNPIVYFYRFAVKHIHEFIADQKAIETGIDKADYALILLSRAFDAPAHQLVTPFFNKSLLKQRITMLQKSRSHRVAIVKYFLTAPLFMLMLILSSATVHNNKTLILIDKKVQIELAKPANPLTLLKQRDGRTADTPKSPKHVIVAGVDDTSKNKKVFTAVDHVPVFPGGLTAFYNFLAKNIHYPDAARSKNVQGRVIISFIVETDGSLSNFEVKRGIGSGCDEEAVRVFSMSPKWTPGTQNGHTVRVQYAVPINFTLAGDDKGGKTPGTKTGAATTPGDTNDPAANMVKGPDTAHTRLGNEFAGAKYFVHTPLYIVDGVERTNPNNIDLNNILSISVLKEKQGIDLYGAKGANGVVVITTRNGKTKTPLTTPVKG